MATLGRWNRTITDAAGNVANATVTVYKESDGLIATIYSDRAGATPKSNPFTLSNSDYGLAFFHAAGGAYKVVAVSGSYSQTWRYEPVGTGAEFDSDSLSGVTPPTTTVPAGIHIAEATNNGSNYVNLTVPDSLTGNRTATLPDADISLIGGALGSTDNRLLRADGTGGVTAQNSAITVDDSGNMSGVGTLAAGATTLSGLLTLTAGQAKFPGSQNASSDANTLDDYEEGSFTPGMTFNGSASGVATSAASGSYIKVGQSVFFSFTLTLTNNGSGSGVAKFTGLPFTSNGFPAVFPVCLIGGGSSASGIFALVDASSTTATLYIPGATAASQASDTNCTNTFDVRVSGVYQAAA